jgi:aspartate racemase
LAKHIGIVACSAEGAALCYRTICIEAEQYMGKHAHPEVTMHTHPLSEYMRFIIAHDNQGVADLMLSSTQKLAGAGAEFAICPDNTIHESFDLVAAKSPLPWLHIAEEVSAEAKRRAFKQVAVLGTRYLMEGPVYPRKLSANGIKHAIPEPAKREQINHIIFDELVRSRFSEDSRNYVTRVIDGLKLQGCDAVILGCTELPLLVTEEYSSLPILDSTRILARAALRFATQ